jgi:hypothetical protein
MFSSLSKFIGVPFCQCTINLPPKNDELLAYNYPEYVPIPSPTEALIEKNQKQRPAAPLLDTSITTKHYGVDEQDEEYERPSVIVHENSVNTLSYICGVQ